VIAADSETVLVGGPDPNGVSEVTACFSRDALRRLFSNLTGRASADATLDATLRDGHGWSAPLRIDVIGPGPELSVLVAPNPINPVGTLTFVTQRAGPARLRLFDVRGRLVRTLLRAAFLGPGFHDVVIDGRGPEGTPLHSGIYYYRLETAEGNREGRIAVVK
jgi:hypothetical protein